MTYRTFTAKWTGRDGVEHTNTTAEGSQKVLWVPPGPLAGFFLWVILATGFVFSIGAWSYFFFHLGSVLSFIFGG